MKFRCEDCGEVFDAVVNEQYCPTCKEIHKLVAQWYSKGEEVGKYTKKCPICGNTFTTNYSNRVCDTPECTKQYTKQYRAVYAKLNKDMFRDFARKYRKQNPERFAKINQTFIEKHTADGTLQERRKGYVKKHIAKKCAELGITEKEYNAMQIQKLYNKYNCAGQHEYYLLQKAAKQHGMSVKEYYNTYVVDKNSTVC